LDARKMPPMNYIALLEERVLPLLNEAHAVMSGEYPAYKFKVWSSAVGSNTQYQGHHLALECLLPDATDDEADNFALLIGVMHLTTEPMICEACVDWSEGRHPDICIELVATPLPFCSETVDQITSRLPELLLVFRKALRAWEIRSRP
jgi:hypothetical protein